MSFFQMLLESIDAADMIGMHMRQNDLARSSSFRQQLVEAPSERVLFVFVWRRRIDHEHLARVVNQIAVSVRRRWFRRRAHGEADVVWTKLNPPHWLAMRVRDRQKSFDQIASQDRKSVV